MSYGHTYQQTHVTMQRYAVQYMGGASWHPSPSGPSALVAPHMVHNAGAAMRVDIIAQCQHSPIHDNAHLHRSTHMKRSRGTHVGWPCLEPWWGHPWHHDCVVRKPCLLQPALAAGKAQDQAVMLDGLQKAATRRAIIMTVAEYSIDMRAPCLPQGCSKTTTRVPALSQPWWM
jgi:hypothetical protein